MAESTNPFSARSLRPGTIRYLFPAGESADEILRRWSAAGHRGQIVGPHGSGKSTLLATLAPGLRDTGYSVCTFALRDRQRSLPRDWKTQVVATLEARAKPLVVVDGYEQLSFWSRFQLKRQCRRHDWGFLVTAHHDVGLPTVATTSTSVELAAAVVDQLDPAARSLLGSDTIADCFVRSGGNLRETLFALYDRYEQIVAK